MHSYFMQKVSDYQTYCTYVLSTNLGSFWFTYFHYFWSRHSFHRRVLVHFVGIHGHKAKEEHKFSSTDRRKNRSGEHDNWFLPPEHHQLVIHKYLWNKHPYYIVIHNFHALKNYYAVLLKHSMMVFNYFVCDTFLILNY